MFYAIVFIVIAAALHVVISLPLAFACVGGLGGMVLVWVLWEAKWLILGCLGLAAVFGGGEGEEA